MGFLDRFRGKSAVADPTSPSMGAVNSAIVTQVDDQIARYKDVAGYRDLAPMVRDLALDLAMFNARALSSVSLRLYMPEGAARKARRMRYRSVGRIGQHRLHTATGANGVGTKAASRADMAGDVVEVTDHPILDLLRRPDPNGTALAWETLRWVNKQCFGETLLVKLPGSEWPVVGLPQLQPQWARAQPDDDRYISGYYFGRDGHEQIAFDADDVIVMPWAKHPHQPYRGLGPLELAARELEIDDHAIASELVRWKNGGYPEGVIAFQNAKNQKQLDEAIDAFQRQLMRSRRRGGVIATSESTYTPLAKAEEMNYVVGLELVERRCLNRFGIPEALYKMNDSNRASSLSADPAYVNYTINPALVTDAEQWTELLVPAWGIDPDEMWFCYDAVGAEDQAVVRENERVYVSTGIKTINESRQELGLPPIDDPNADKLLFNGLPLGAQPLPAAPSMGFSPVVNVDRPREPDAVEPEAPEAAEAPEADEAPDDEEKAAEPLTLIGKSWCDSDPYHCDHDHEWHTKDDDRLNVPEEAEKRIRDIVREWMRLAATQVTVDAIGRGAVSLADLDRDLEQALEPVLAELFASGARDGFVSINRDPSDIFDVVPEQALESLRRHNSLIIEQIRGTTEDGIRRAIEEAVGDGLSADEASKVVRDAVAEASPHRAEAIARTESANAMEAGNQTAWIAAGVEHHRMLLAAGACSICRAIFEKINGRTDAVGKSAGLESKGIPIGTVIVKAGETIVGDDGRRMQFRLTRTHGPFHPHDRCVMNADPELDTPEDQDDAD